jgi:hypothetical protein
VREEGRKYSVARSGLNLTWPAPGTTDNGTKALERPDLRHDAHPNHRLSGGVLDRTPQKNAAQPGRGERSAHVGREHDDGQDKANGNGRTGLASHCPFPLRRCRHQSQADSLCPCSLLKLPSDSIIVKQNSLDERHSIVGTEPDCKRTSTDLVRASIVRCRTEAGDGSRTIDV